MPGDPAGQFSGHRPGVSGHGHVVVSGGSAKQAIPHGTPNQPGRDIQRSQRGERIGRFHNQAGSPSQWYSRGTRPEIPHTTS
jgi:hypothetical protein